MAAGIQEYPDRAFRGFPQPVYNSGYCPKLGHELFIPHTFQFTIPDHPITGSYALPELLR
jgi:hypothetical protein